MLKNQPKQFKYYMIMEQYQTEKLYEFRERKVFSPFLFIIVDGQFIYTGKIMKHVLIKERKYKIP